jgi:probable rRNA maturation factor
MLSGMKLLEKLSMHMNKKIQINFFCKSNLWSRRMVKIREIAKKVIKIDDLKFIRNNFYVLNLVFVDDKNIKKINKEYRKKNKTTDVLTFVNSIKNNKNINETYCDIFFSAETIKKDAKKNIINFYDHITHLMIHCFLHVNGYDHKKETDFIKMKNLEEKILMKFDIESPYLV